MSSIHSLIKTYLRHILYHTLLLSCLCERKIMDRVLEEIQNRVNAKRNYISRITDDTKQTLNRNMFYGNKLPVVEEKHFKRKHSKPKSKLSLLTHNITSQAIFRATMAKTKANTKSSTQEYHLTDLQANSNKENDNTEIKPITKVTSTISFNKTKNIFSKKNHNFTKSIDDEKNSKNGNTNFGQKNSSNALDEFFGHEFPDIFDKRKRSGNSVSNYRLFKRHWREDNISQLSLPSHREVHLVESRGERSDYGDNGDKTHISVRSYGGDDCCYHDYHAHDYPVIGDHNEEYHHYDDDVHSNDYDSHDDTEEYHHHGHNHDPGIQEYHHMEREPVQHAHMHHHHYHQHDHHHNYHSDGDNQHNHPTDYYHGPGKTPSEWAIQEEREQQQMPGENSEINNYDTGAGFFQLEQNGGEVDVAALRNRGTKVHMSGGHFDVIRDPWRYHSAFAGLLHPHESVTGRGTPQIGEFHQHFTYVTNERNENHQTENLVNHDNVHPEHYEEERYEEDEDSNKHDSNHNDKCNSRHFEDHYYKCHHIGDDYHDYDHNEPSHHEKDDHHDDRKYHHDDHEDEHHENSNYSHKDTHGETHQQLNHDTGFGKHRYYEYMKGGTGDYDMKIKNNDFLKKFKELKKEMKDIDIKIPGLKTSDKEAEKLREFNQGKPKNKTYSGSKRGLLDFDKVSELQSVPFNPLEITPNISLSFENKEKEIALNPHDYEDHLKRDIANIVPGYQRNSLPIEKNKNGEIQLSGENFQDLNNIPPSITAQGFIAPFSPLVK